MNGQAERLRITFFTGQGVNQPAVGQSSLQSSVANQPRRPYLFGIGRGIRMDSSGSIIGVGGQAQATPPIGRNQQQHAIVADQGFGTSRSIIGVHGQAEATPPIGREQQHDDTAEDQDFGTKDPYAGLSQAWADPTRYADERFVTGLVCAVEGKRISAYAHEYGCFDIHLQDLDASSSSIEMGLLNRRFNQLQLIKIQVRTDLLGSRERNAVGLAVRHIEPFEGRFDWNDLFLILDGKLDVNDLRSGLIHSRDFGKSYRISTALLPIGYENMGELKKIEEEAAAGKKGVIAPPKYLVSRKFNRLVAILLFHEETSMNQVVAHSYDISAQRNWLPAWTSG